MTRMHVPAVLRDQLVDGLDAARATLSEANSLTTRAHPLTGGHQAMRGIGSGNSEGRPPSRPPSQHGSKNRGSGESFDPATAFVVDLPLSEVQPPAPLRTASHDGAHCAQVGE